MNRIDGYKHSAIFHPTWEMRYLTPTSGKGATDV